MKVMVMVKATKESEAGQLPSEQMLREMGQFNEELVKAGIMLSGEGLHPSSAGARVRFSGKDRSVIDGPFAETKELVAGFWMWQVKSLEEAVAWVKRCPNPMESESEIEIRRVFEPEDFGEAFTPELQRHEQRLRDELERNNLESPRMVHSPGLRVAGFNETYTFENRSNIPLQWQRFAPKMNQVPGRQGEASFGVCWHYQPGRGFDYLTGVEVSADGKLPAEFTDVELPAGRYAVFTHRQHVSSIATTLDAIWTRWLPNSGREAAESPSFERYDKRFDPATGLGGFEIWVPLKG